MSEQTTMLERAAKAIYLARNGTGVLPWSRREAAHKEPYLKDARAVIEALLAGPIEGAMLAAAEAEARNVNRFASESRIKSVALDALSIHRAMLRTILSQPTKDRV